MSLRKGEEFIRTGGYTRGIVCPGGVVNAATRKPAGPTGPSLTDIQVLFRLDPRITKGMYMGDRWVSPPTYTLLGDEQKCIVSAQATGLDAQKKEVAIGPNKSVIGSRHPSWT